MSKAFTKNSDNDEQEEPKIPTASHINYMTPTGLAALQDEYRDLFYKERPKILEIVRWAAGNGDRSENGDYIYGKKRLREIDRRVRYLKKRIESAKVIDPNLQKHLSKVFFGATVSYARSDGSHMKVQLVGVDEADLTKGKISWISPVAQALLKSEVGDVVILRTPLGEEKVEILAIEY